MTENLRIIQETQEKANKIIDNALIEAAKIEKGLLPKSTEAYEETYRTEIAQAEKYAKNLLKSSSKSIEVELEQILKSAKQLVIEVEKQVKTKEQEAVKHIINIVFHRSEKL